MRLSLLLFASFVLCFQGIAGGEKTHFCGTTQAVERSLALHPEYKKAQQDLETFTQHYRPDAAKSAQVYVIPVVFHIIHEYGGENISDQQVIDGMRVLNEDYRKLNADASTVVSAFKGIAADCEIEFRLAKKDPNGNCTNGIDRIVSSKTNSGDDAAKLNPWPNNMYLNIWTVRNLTQDGISGYAYYPGSAGNSVDGIILLSDYIGTFGTGTYSKARVISHEVGHYLNLRHVWGNTNDPGVSCGDDFVSDTPTTEGWLSCNLSGTTCGSLDNVQNFMDYSFCYRMFTEGQKTRMRAALSASASGRNNLWTPSNLVATGTDGGNYAPCIPIADFSVNKTQVCTGVQVTYNDLSWKGRPSSWNWTFPGGTPSSSTDSVPVVTYNSPGTYGATLTTGNVSGNSNPVNKSSVVNIITTVPKFTATSYAEDFQNATAFAADWDIVNDGGKTWQYSSSTGYNSSGCLWLNNFSNTVAAKDEIISSGVDMTKVPGTPKLTFRLSYAQKTTTSVDALEVYYSVNCGETWVKRKTIGGTSLGTVAAKTSSYTPSGSSDWREETVAIGATKNYSNVLFKFVFLSGDSAQKLGNNIYIDDINIDGSIEISELLENSLAFAVYPNPADQNTVIELIPITQQYIAILLVDMMGREVYRFFEGDMLPQRYAFPLSAAGCLAPGIYQVQVRNNEGSMITRKLMVK